MVVKSLYRSYYNGPHEYGREIAKNFPKFTRKFKNRSDSSVISQLQTIFNSTITTGRFQEQLDAYSCFVFVQTTQTNAKKIIWKEQARLFSSYLSSNVRHYSIPNKVDSRFIDNKLKIPCLEQNSNIYCHLLDLSTAEVCVSLSSYVSTLRKSNLTLLMVGFNLIDPDQFLINHLKSFIKESSHKYENLNYSKLLEIATKRSNPDNKSVQELLVSLARLGLSKPLFFSNHDKWIGLSLDVRNISL